MFLPYEDGMHRLRGTDLLFFANPIFTLILHRKIAERITY